MGAWRTVVLFIGMVTSVACLSCPSCKEQHCSQPPPCVGDIVKDPCGCCDVCAKVEGERCGGPWKISGECSSGLFCDKDDNDFNAVGVCKPKKLLCGSNSHFSMCGGMCRPTCDNPTPICPAVCFPGCACDKGFVWSEDTCIPLKICPKKCPAGSHWSMCGSDCPPSCKEPIRACNKMCVPSCVCDVWDHVWHYDRCIPLKQCPPEGCEYKGRTYKEGDSWGEEDQPGKNCFCREGRPQCLFVDCFRPPTSQHVRTKDGTWDCQKLETGQCPQGYIKPQSSKGMYFCYRFDTKRLSYGDAESSCRADGGRLVTIRDYRTQLWVAIRTVLQIRQSTWVGLDDRKTDRRLVWSDLVPYSRKDYKRWDRGVLNTENNDCAYMSRPRKFRWRLGWCKAKRPYICEYDPFAVSTIRAYQDF